MTRQYVKIVYSFASPFIHPGPSPELGPRLRLFLASVSDFPVQSRANQLSLAPPMLTCADQLHTLHSQLSKLGTKICFHLN